MIFKPLKLIVTLAILSAVVCTLAACKSQGRQNNTEPLIISTTQATTVYTTAPAVTEIDDDIPQIDTYIILDDEKTTINGTGATFERGILTIKEGGAYQLEGSLSDGKIVINSNNETKKVKLVLSGVNITCSTDAPLFVEKSPDETVLILKSGTDNIFSDTARTIPEGIAEYATATIYSKDDLQLEGSGNLTVNGNFGKGIFSKKDIDIRGGSITVNALDDGIRGKNSVEIEAGTLNITCGGDGVRTNAREKEDKGNIDINGGTLTINSELDAIQATGSLTVTGGTVNAVSGGGATGESTDYRQQEMLPFMMGKNPESSRYEESESDTPSTKGIKADKAIYLQGGTLVLDCLDDSVHAPEIIITKGDLTLSSDDDGIHADEALTVNGGKVNILKSYEGIEGRTININDGEITLISSDDGLNAAAKETAETTEASPESRSFSGRPGGPGGMMDYDSTCSVTMTGGFVLINAQGDGIDSNGSVNMSGGKMIVFGPTMGANGALDYGGSFTVSGGTVFACGAMGMAQSVTGDGVSVLNFDVNGNAGEFYALTDSSLNCKIAFTAPKDFQNVVFASDTISASEIYSFYSDGLVSADGNMLSGICFGGSYKAGTMLGAVRSN